MPATAPPLPPPPVLGKKQYRTFEAQQVKLSGKSDSGAGWIEGYAAVFGVVDSMMERIQPGAFAKTIQERVRAKKVSLLIQHMRDGGDFMEEVAIMTEAKEDSFGLWFHADFLPDQFSQDVRQKVLAREEMGAKTRFSIGYQVIQYVVTQDPEGKQDPIYDLMEIKLYETTITIRPVLEDAELTAAKSDNMEPPPPSVEPSPEDEAGAAGNSTALLLAEMQLARAKSILFLERSRRP